MATAFSNINGLSVTVPNQFAGILPVSPSSAFFAYEPETFAGLKRAVCPGIALLDVGCSYGVTATLAGLLMSRSGTIYAFDGNQAVFPYARLLASRNGVQVTWNWSLVGETSSVEGVPFYVVPGFASVASTRNPGIVSYHRDASCQSVPMISVDDYCKTNALRPGCIKIDVEGSEFAVLLGAQGVLRTVRPSLVIETHGDELIGIRGSVPELVSLLVAEGYSLVDLHAGAPTAPESYASKYSHRIGHLLAVPGRAPGEPNVV